MPTGPAIPLGPVPVFLSRLAGPMTPSTCITFPVASLRSRAPPSIPAASSAPDAFQLSEQRFVTPSHLAQDGYSISELWPRPSLPNRSPDSEREDFSFSESSSVPHCIRTLPSHQLVAPRPAIALCWLSALHQNLHCLPLWLLTPDHYFPAEALRWPNTLPQHPSSCIVNSPLPL